MGCKATTKAGKPCKAAPLTDTDFCLAHSDAETRESAGFVADNGFGGRKRLPKEVELYEKVWLANQPKLTEALERGITATRHVVVGNGPTARVEEVPDIPTQIKSVEIITDRLAGKPRQAMELSGSEGGPIEFQGIDPNHDGKDWYREVAKALKGSGALDANTDQDQ